MKNKERKRLCVKNRRSNFEKGVERKMVIAHSETVTTTTKNALISSQLGPCETYPHKLKVSIIGAGNVGMACAIAILMRRIASEIVLVDKNKEKVEAEAEDIRHASIFLGNPLVIGTKEIGMIKESAVVIIAVGDPAPGDEPNVEKNWQIFKKIIPGVAKWCPKTVIVVVTQPIEVMSYIAWKLSKFPHCRILGTGTLIDSVRFQYHLAQKFGLANNSINCMNIGAQGKHSVPVWSSVNVAGMKLRDINPKMGEKDDPEKWYEIGTTVNECGSTLNQQKGLKGPNSWGLGFCTAEIVDAILRNTRVVLPASTYIKSCAHGTDKDIFMSIPCVIGREGILQTVKQKLSDEEKNALQKCADEIRSTIRECGILQEDESEVILVEQAEG
ncbi:L-lactate dehydrogenase A chain-like isoform X1 [Leptopilina heterotoma]|uniref:L-lactate dehydrogenase A chain-like isoform X1 n=2 Tax=Leptopilina heterotoma TaxID=63436 RepID=UPI001CA83EC1|nr:L-lactate dehydrogenase A chain-like isoform X1 [Leptopilina heterotoma]